MKTVNYTCDICKQVIFDNQNANTQNLSYQQGKFEAFAQTLGINDYHLNCLLNLLSNTNAYVQHELKKRREG